LSAAPDGQLQDRAVVSLALASHIAEQLIRSRIHENPAGFWPSSPKALERWARKNLLHVTRHGQALEVAVTSALKRLRSAAARDIPDPRIAPLIAAARNNGVNTGLCVLTHDVDWKACYRALDWLCALELQNGVRSTFHFLTEWRYRPDADYLAQMRSQGFEIGLHGRLHDAGIGYRRRAVILDELKRALAVLPPGIAAYRAPTLCLSMTLLSVLREVGITVDSSMLTTNRYGVPAESVWPYEIAEGVTELPLSIQDDLLFRDLRLDDDAALDVAGRCMEAIHSAGGVFVFNGHPGILRDHEKFYRGLLGLIAASGRETVTISQAANKYREAQDVAV
jgi:hypothetical protein